MSISGAISNNIICKEPVIDFLKREMGKSYAMRQGDPMLLVTPNVSGGPLISIKPKDHLISYDPSQTLQMHLPFSQVAELDYLMKMTTVRKGLDTIKKGIEGNPKDLQLLTFPLIPPMVPKPPPQLNPPLLQMPTMMVGGMHPVQSVMRPQFYNPNPVYQSSMPPYQPQAQANSLFPTFKQ